MIIKDGAYTVLLLLRIRSARLETPRFPMSGAY